MSCEDIRRVFDEVLAGYPESERAKRARSADRIVWQASEALKMTTPGGVILDIGAGHSLFAPVCAKLGLEVTIVDDFADSLEAPEMAGIRDHFDRIGVRVIMGDVFETKLPFAEESIDLVVTIDSIEHWHKSPKKLFQSLYEKIVPGGVLWVGAGGQSPIHEKLKAASPCDHPDVVPLPFSDIRHPECIGNRAVVWILVFADDKFLPTMTGMFPARCEVEIPRAKNMRTDANVTEVGVISLERAFAARIGACPNLDAGIALGP